MTIYIVYRFDRYNSPKLQAKIMAAFKSKESRDSWLIEAKRCLKQFGDIELDDMDFQLIETEVMP